MNISLKHVTKEWILRIAAGRIILKHVISGVYNNKMQNNIFADYINNVLTNFIFNFSDKRILLHAYYK
jgi:hypothetical protein